MVMESDQKLRNIIEYTPMFWKNPKKTEVEPLVNTLELSERDMMEAALSWKRFAFILTKLFPETQNSKGLIESELREIASMKEWLENSCDIRISGRFFVKCDNELPVAGSIKARGGIYEVLKHAEDLALKNGMLKLEDDYSIMATEEFKHFYNQYSIAVGSTGNLGLSIGIMGAALGFKVTVHMSADAKEWKKELLRKKGVTVIEYESDYGKAVEAGRKQSQSDPNSYFVDDEQSKVLFLGYSVAAYRLKEQLEAKGLIVDNEHPLIVYLPCGVGGAPGGITFGLKQVFGDNAYCFFAEPTHSPCMLLGLMTGNHEKLSVQDYGLDNKTEADGLAVGSPSGLVGRMVGKWIDGVFTVEDEELFPVLTMLWDLQGIRIEPSAAAGFLGPCRILSDRENGYSEIFKVGSIHIFWATGGLLVPETIMSDFYSRGLEILQNNN